jgi:hypothetical protein
MLNASSYYKTNQVDLFTSQMTKSAKHAKRWVKQWWKLFQRIIHHSKVRTLNRSGSSTLTIHHFNRPVTYFSEGFLEWNLDVLNSDLVSLLHGATNSSTDVSRVEGSNSINPFIESLLPSKAIITHAHP